MLDVLKIEENKIWFRYMSQIMVDEGAKKNNTNVTSVVYVAKLETLKLTSALFMKVSKNTNVKLVQKLSAFLDIF